MGRGVHVPKFGVFTFTPPEVRLKVKSILCRESPTKNKEI